MTDSKKWACEYCTYENWIASKKCTLCYAIRSPQYITEPATSSQDIYNMANLMRKPPDIKLPSQEISAQNRPQQPIGKTTQSSQPSTSTISCESTNSDVEKKWACLLCTYLNWPKALHCTQCQHERHKGLSTVSSTIKDNINYSTPLSINVNIAEASGGVPNNSKAQENISPSEEVAKESKKNLSKEQIFSEISAAVRGKWICPACTYENWPKATKCILCATGRGQLRDSPSPVSDTEHIKSKQQTTPESPDGASAAISLHPAGPPQRSSQKHVYPAKNPSKQMTELDWLWLNACEGVIDGNIRPIEGFIVNGGDPSRQITQEEALLLSRPSAFQPGYTLIHLAIRFKRDDILATLLRARDVMSPKAKKIVPAHISPNTATDLLRQIAASLRQRKGDFPCFFTTEFATFSLPADIEDLPLAVQKQLFDEFLDRDVQHELEVSEAAINWSLEITDRYCSRLYPLWNRTCGNCLLDSALQATWGVFDRDNVLRRAVADSLAEGMTLFYPRWKETEAAQEHLLHFTLEEGQLQQDWATILSLASQPGASLEQIHIFALSHVLRRPIIVYGIKYVKNSQGENLSLARFQGVYLPLLWEVGFCWKSPIALGYTRGHFSALVPMDNEMEDNLGAGLGAGAKSEGNNGDEDSIIYLPLTDFNGKLLPIHFLVGTEVGREEALLKEWLDCWWTDNGLLVAQMKLHCRPMLVTSMLNEWLNRYRHITHSRQSANQHNNQNISQSHLSPTLQISEQRTQDLSSDEAETDDE